MMALMLCIECHLRRDDTVCHKIKDFSLNKNFFILFYQKNFFLQYPPPELLAKWKPFHDICVPKTGVNEGMLKFMLFI